MLGTREVRAFGMPEVLLLIRPCDGAIVRDEIRYVVKLIAVFPDDGAGDDADVEFLCKSLVGIEVGLVLGAEGDETRVVGNPVGEMVFWEDGEVSTFGGGGADEGDCFGVVGFYGQGLKRTT